MGYRDTVLADSPSGYWRLGDAAGPTVTATVGNNLTATNGPTFGVASLLTAADANAAMLFIAASSTDATGSDTGLPTGNGAWSVDAWVKTTTAAEVGLVYWGTPGSGRDVMFGILSGALIFDTSSFFNSFGGTTVNNGKPHHVALTWDGTTMLAYVDGTQVGVGYSPGALNITLAGAAGTLLGRRSALYYDGTLDEVAIYPSTLTPGKIKEHFGAGINPPYSYRPVIVTSKYRGPQSLRRQFRRPVLYPSDVAVAGPQNLLLTATDSLTYGESMDRLFTGFRDTTDSTARADAATRAVTLLRTTTDAVARADVATRLVTLLRAATDSTTYADAATRTATLLRSATDAVARSDAATRTVTLLRSVTDSTTYADVAAAVKSIARQATDSVTYADAATRTVTLLRAATDAVARSDAATRTVTLLRAATDSVTYADAATKSMVFIRSVTDSVTYSDVAAQIKSIARQATDSVTYADAATRTATLLRNATDSVTWADVAARVGTFPRTVTDAVTRSDVATKAAALLRTVADSVARSDVAAFVISQQVIVGLPPVAAALRFIARVTARSPRPDSDANHPKPE